MEEEEFFKLIMPFSKMATFGKKAKEGTSTPKTRGNLYWCEESFFRLKKQARNLEKGGPEQVPPEELLITEIITTLH